MENFTDYTTYLDTIITILKSINVYCWGLLAWKIVSHIRSRFADERRK